MKPLFLTLLLATLCATAYGQTIKALGYNTNGVVIGPTNALTFTNSASFPQLNTATTATNNFLSAGNFFAASNTSEGNATFFRIGTAEEENKSAQFAYRAGGTNFGREGFLQLDLFGADYLFQLTHDELTPELWTDNPPQKLITFGSTITTPRPIGFEGTNTAIAAATTRTNLGIPLPALTNTNAQNLLDALGVTGGDALVQGIQVDRAKVLWDSADDDWGFQAVDGSWKTQAVFTTTNAPTNTNAAIWIAVEIGTNTYKLPLFQ
jgi:hypothetical protein